MDEERYLANWRPRSPTLRWRIALQRYGSSSSLKAIAAKTLPLIFLERPDTIEGAFVEAEPHLLAAGKRDSARVLAEMMVDWSAGTNPGHFALHGVLPYVSPFPLETREE